MLIKRNWVVFVRVLPIAPYSARDWLSIDTFSLEIIQQWAIFGAKTYKGNVSVRYDPNIMVW